VELALTRSTSSEPQQSAPVYSVLPGGMGYIDLTRLTPAQVDSAFEAVAKTPGVILDLRGYSNGLLTALPSRLTGQKTAGALIRRWIWHGPDPALASLETHVQYVIPGERPKYEGRVAVLIDARAVSQPEHLCLLLEASTNVVFVGSPTSGADGDVTNTVLPGGIQVNFAGQEIRHADGRPLQRVGILPDVWAEPTIGGIREGRDEVLEKAIETLKARTANPVR
jgi:C-terminal processing protease CtpA/Prc